MPKKNPNLVETRREEIINSCEELYQKMNFKDITIMEIGKVTPFKRTTIYNYFNTKEEIFLALLKREYDFWIEELENISASHKTLSKKKLADALAKSLENRSQLLKLMTMNHFDMEMNSSAENLADFKRSYGKSLQAVKKCLDKFCPDFTESDKENFLYAFFPFVYGIYPYAVVTEKQKSAMKAANVDYKFYSIHELAYNFLIKLLS